MQQKQIFDDDDWEPTDEEWANARIGDPDIILPVTRPREAIVRRARENVAAMDEVIKAGGHPPIELVLALRDEALALIELASRDEN